MSALPPPPPSSSVPPPPPVPPPSSSSTPAGGSDLVVTAVVTPEPPALVPTLPPASGSPVLEPLTVAPEPPTAPPAETSAAAPPPSVEATIEYGEYGEHEVHVRCPNCDTVWAGTDLRPHAQWFCGNCDYPLFWAQAPTSHVVGDSDDGAAFARLPGTDGRETLSSIACPHCGERNQPDPSRNCLRCGLPLTLRDDPVIEHDVVTVVHTQVLPPLPTKRRRIWPWIVVAAVCATAFITTLLIVVFNP